MSEEDDSYSEEDIDKILDAVEEFLGFTMFHMATGTLGIASDNPNIPREYVNLYRKLYCAMAKVEEKDAGIYAVEEFIGDGDGTAETDGASGSPEADSWSESGNVRPSSRKLH